MFHTGLSEDALPGRMRTSPPIPESDQSACLGLVAGQESVPHDVTDDDLSQFETMVPSDNGDYKGVRGLDEIPRGSTETLEFRDSPNLESDREFSNDEEIRRIDDSFDISTTYEESDDSKRDTVVNSNTQMMRPLNESLSSSTLENESSAEEEEGEEEINSLEPSEPASLVSEDYSFDHLPVVNELGVENVGRNETSLFDELKAGRLHESFSSTLDSSEDNSMSLNKDNDDDAELGASNTGHDSIAQVSTKTPEKPAPPSKLNLIVSPLQPTKSFKNGVAIFVCEVISKRVGVAWEKDGQKIEASSKYVVTRAGKMHSLTIHDVQAGDEGQYSIVCDDDQASSAGLEVRGVSSS
ncbi:obscurin-like protein 1 isoform C [Elysia marginata]|uniref:Obscurin-like protein 1 isoform C n=1 Tax=Elysia marginata TaxID=1093978 RepID=A0AAV4HRT8_9GAST|nr:obscurin-like protein 1 isoform C [Elysia marginata]